MICQDVHERIDAIAEGEDAVEPEVRAHIEGCVRCAERLAAARRLEQALASRPAPAAPAKFAAGVLARIRRERWRSEQNVDRLFNAGLVAGLALVVAGIAALLNVGSLADALPRATTILGRLGGTTATTAAPLVSTYVSGAGLLLTALVVWWWAETKLTMDD